MSISELSMSLAKDLRSTCPDGVDEDGDTYWELGTHLQTIEMWRRDMYSVRPQRNVKYVANTCKKFFIKRYQGDA